MALGLPSVLVGSWTDEDAATGVTVVLPPPGTLGAIAVRGGAPGTREAAALSSTGAGVECHGVVLCGNSVFGLAAADGVVRWCASQGRGLDIRDSIVPVVGAAVVYDIAGPDSSRPTAEAGWAACEAASADEPVTGRVGVGRGCTIGKVAGRDFSVPGALGVAVERSGDLVVGALVAVNALGDVIDADGAVLAGCTAEAGAARYPYDAVEAIPGFTGRGDADADELARSNTTIGCLVTNARLTKPEACRAADLAHTGIARAIEPPHTNFDGDALFLLATGEVDTQPDLVATLGAAAVARAIRSEFAS
ncbi:MAG: P1 family peptidase [Acidimicrobiales bacterium]|nr:P1 family peptidase [Acidimicrobiales bacterium]MYA25580.1 P1 family peptidase [Acidimicrobiales bacterium]MYD83618.1 P1 family peptidase [Acidimicrobiales bacterium]MYG89463.1 P1 family peptidase [Acidimicrobiales bacterium]MYI26652.1 P1 family peptidase [Acidimicrobiales bacterium]